MTKLEKEWDFTEKNTAFLRFTEKFSQKNDLSKSFTSLLLSRLYKQYPQFFEGNKEDKISKAVELYLNPSLQKLLHPTFLPQVEEAAQIIVRAIKEEKKILIWGDYDVDGITSSALCTEFFKKHNYTVYNHIPCREQGYGINQDVLAKYIDEEFQLIISVDCGISDYESIEYAKSRNIDVIITDHHLLPERLPNADAIINPYLVKESEELLAKDIRLAGVGVAFFFLCQMNNVLNQVFGTKCDMRDFLDLVALGTIADMMPLIGQNRILVKNGLLKIAESQRIGIRALKEVAGYAPHASLSAGQISFGLAPRINAAGRMDNPRIALDLLLCADYTEAKKLASQLDDWNHLRKQEEEEIVAQAMEQALKYENEPTLVLMEDDWNQGIIGIVASRMVEKFHKPTFILTKNQCENYVKGSGRSVKKFHLYNALIESDAHLLSFGGHEYAAGLKIDENSIDDFRASFNAFFKKNIGEQKLIPMLSVESEVSFDEVANYTFLKELELLEPFGIGNSEPIYASYEVEITKLDPFAYGKHLKIEVLDKKSGQRLQSKIWNAKNFEHKVGDVINVAYNIEIDTYNNSAHICMKIKDIK